MSLLSAVTGILEVCGLRHGRTASRLQRLLISESSSTLQELAASLHQPRTFGTPAFIGLLICLAHSAQSANTGNYGSMLSSVGHSGTRKREDPRMICSRPRRFPDKLARLYSSMSTVIS